MEEDLSFPDMNIEIMDQHMWDTVASDWLDEFIEELNELSARESNVDFDFDFVDFVKDMNPQDWENAWNDVLDNFDANLFSIRTGEQ